MYQYSMTALLWIVSLPMIILFIMVGMRDNLKFGCYPVVLVNLIFSFMLFLLSQITIITSLIYTEDILILASHLLNYGIFGISLASNFIYRAKYAKYDIAKEPSGDDDEANHTAQ